MFTLPIRTEYALVGRFGQERADGTGQGGRRVAGRVDERVAMAISHWAPRFTMNGGTAGDFERITSELTSWNAWCAAWSTVAAEHESLGREALTEGREMSAGAHLSQAAVYYHFAKFLFVSDPGQMRGGHMRGRALPADRVSLP